MLDPYIYQETASSGATQSVLLYGEKVWAGALDKEVYRKRLAKVKRSFASGVAVMVIARVFPVTFFAMESIAIYSCKGEDLREVVAREERQRTLAE